jgi:hypothetical protein
VVATPPRRNQNVPLVALDALKGTALLQGDPSRFGHFFIELDNGERYLDANLGQLSTANIAVPQDSTFFLRTASAEAEVRAGDEDRIELAQLTFVDRQVVPRGSADLAYRTALFKTAYGVDYYKGYVDSTGVVGVRFAEPAQAALAVEEPPAYQEPLAITALAAAGASAAACVVTGILAAQAKQDFEDTSFQREAREANDRYVAMGNAAIGTGVAAAVLGLAGWLLWPEEAGESQAVVPSAVASPSGAWVQLGLRW